MYLNGSDYHRRRSDYAVVKLVCAFVVRMRQGQSFSYQDPSVISTHFESSSANICCVRLRTEKVFV